MCCQPVGKRKRFGSRPTGLDFGDWTRTGTFRVAWSYTKAAGQKLLNGSVAAVGRLEAKQGRRVFAVVTKLQLHLGYLTKGFQSQLEVGIPKGEFPKGQP